ncbi:MAG: 23S rRNA (guanosine(2251)-2'-O)-methyltransferase RlmB [Elusimicrobiota bacterium]
MEKEDIIYGRNAIFEAINSGKEVSKLIISKSARGHVVQDIIDLAKEKKIPFSFVHPKKLDDYAAESQGIVAFISVTKLISITELLDSLTLDNNPVICVLDGIMDPHNLGAIIRSAYVLGVKGIIIPKRNSCGINATVAKTSSGAVSKMAIAQVSNVAQAIDICKNKGFWVIGTDMLGTVCSAYDFKRPVVLVLGGEEKGIRELVKNSCDDIVRIPQFADFDSLNVSCAAAVLFYEISRQNRT